jgi:radical SAM protein with 4Fe4S-binding SPASM domain
MIAGGTPFLAAPFKLTLSITARCPLACRHCYADCGADARPELDTVQWQGFLDMLHAEGFISVFIEGGEPFARPDIEPILAHAARRLHTTVRTHGTLIDNARAARLAAMPVSRVHLDLSGADATTHDAATGIAGSFDAALAGLRALRAHGVQVTLLTILTRQSAPALPRLLQLAAEEGADELGVLRLYPLGRARRHWADLALSLPEQMAALAALQPRPGVRLMQSWHPNDGNCCWQNAAVDPWGRSIGCPYLREYVDYGDALSGMRATWDHPLYRTLRAQQIDANESCPDCHGNELTRGGCRSSAYAFHGRWDAPDPYCTTLNRGTDLRELPARS